MTDKSKDALEVLYKYASAYADVSQQPQMQSTLLRYKNEINSEVKRLQGEVDEYRNNPLLLLQEDGIIVNLEPPEASEWRKVDLNGHHFLVHPSGAVRRDIASQLKKESDDE